MTGIVGRKGISIGGIIPSTSSFSFNTCRRGTGGQTSTIGDTGIWYDLNITTVLPFATSEGGDLVHLGNGVVENQSAVEKSFDVELLAGFARSTGTALTIKLTYGFWDGASYVADETFQTGDLALPATNNALSSWGGIIPFPVPVVIPAGEKVKLKFNCVSRSSTLVNLNTYYFMQNFTQVAP